MKKIILGIIFMASNVHAAVHDTGNGSTGNIFVWDSNGPGANTTGAWTDSSTVPGLKGADGKNGTNGVNGANGANGIDGAKGIDGKNGKDGKDASNGFSGTALVGDFAIRLYDGKRVQVQAFDVYQFGSHPGDDIFAQGRNQMIGARFILKLGSSYEEREIDKIKKALNIH